MQGSNEGVYNVFLIPPSKTRFFVVSKLVVFSGVFLPCLLLFIPFYSCHIIAEFGDLGYSYIFLNQYVIFFSEQCKKIDFSFGKKEECDLLLELDKLHIG